MVKMAYYPMLRQIHGLLEPATYVEIGVRNGESMALAEPSVVAVGIDPAVDIKFLIGKDTRLFDLTSDDFFERHNLSAELGNKTVELAFLDGMHLFEFALRDFINVEKYCEASSVILLHDCLPIDAESAARERCTNVWSGDVWKLIMCLKKYRPDLRVDTIDVSPTGLGVIRNLNPQSTVLIDQYDVIEKEFIAQSHDVLSADKSASLNVVADPLDSVESLAAFFNVSSAVTAKVIELERQRAQWFYSTVYNVKQMVRRWRDHYE